MTRQRGIAVFGALIAVVALVCTAIFVGLGHGGMQLGLGGTDEAMNQAASGTGRAVQNGGGQGQVGSAAPASQTTWTGTWAAPPVGAYEGAPDGLPGRSIRDVVHTSIGGTAARVTFSNLYGTAPLLIGHASVAVAAGGITGGAAAAPGTLRPLSFGRRASVTIPPGGQTVSDAVALRVPEDGDLLVTLYTPTASGPATYHSHAQQISYLAEGDRTQDPTATAYVQQMASWLYVTAVDVHNRQSRGTIVAFGDSITDGVGSSTDANQRYPDLLFDLLRQQAQNVGGEDQYGIVDEGIGGNQVLEDGSAQDAGRSGLARFTDDALDRAGVKTVIIDLGVNDLLRGKQRDPQKIVDGLRLLTQRAHQRGLRVIGSTLTPFGAHPGCTPAEEAVREQVNAQIRAGGVFDEVVDFDKALRDPYAPDRLRPTYDSGDGLHPNDVGYKVMAETFDLTQLLNGAPGARQL